MRLTGKALLLFALCVAGALAAENSTTTTTSTAVVAADHTQAALSPEVLTNEGIIALANAGFSDAFIVEKILLSNRSRFDVTVEGLSNLRRNAISEGLVLFLMKHTAQSSLPAAAAPAAPSPALPAVVKAKLKMKKIAVPVESIDALIAAPTVTVMNPALAGSARPYEYGYARYGYSYSAPQAAGTASAGQSAGVSAASWWR